LLRLAPVAGFERGAGVLALGLLERFSSRSAVDSSGFAPWQIQASEERKLRGRRRHGGSRREAEAESEVWRRQKDGREATGVSLTAC